MRNLDANIYELKLLESCELNENDVWTSILRVPGGWVVRSWDKSHQIMSAVFVPFNNEFMSATRKEWPEGGGEFV
jgi:hypothetical protein